MSTLIPAKALALARGFTVLIMPAVHTVLLYSSKSVKMGFLGQFLGFLAEGPGAPLFMYLMGVFIVLGRKKNTFQIVTRSVMLLIGGYLLNLLRFTIPFHLGIIPNEYLTENGIKINPSTGLQLLLVGDILQFASIAYFVCSLVYLLKVDVKGIITLLLLLLVITPYTWELSFKSQSIAHLIYLFNGQPPHTFFPIFPWLFYPLLGLLVGKDYQWDSYKSVLRLHVILGSILILTGLLISLTEPIGWNTNFYRVGRGATLWHSGLVLIWVALFLLLSKLIKRSWIFSLLEYLSRHITIIYMAQWVIILWLFPLFGYNELDLIPSLLTLILTSFLSFLLPWLVKRVRRKIQ